MESGRCEIGHGWGIVRDWEVGNSQVGRMRRKQEDEMGRGDIAIIFGG